MSESADEVLSWSLDQSELLPHSGYLELVLQMTFYSNSYRKIYFLEDSNLKEALWKTY